jgi:hypothetical protein
MRLKEIFLAPLENVERATAFYRDLLQLKYLWPDRTWHFAAGPFKPRQWNRRQASRLKFARLLHDLMMCPTLFVIKGKEGCNSTPAADYRQHARS